jgi:carbamoyl-phosphate synthase (ammonia)
MSSYPAHRTTDFYNPGAQNVLGKVSTKEIAVYGEGDVEVLAVDCGIKQSIIRELVKRGAKVKVVPWDHGQILVAVLRPLNSAEPRLA